MLRPALFRSLHHQGRRGLAPFTYVAADPHSVRRNVRHAYQGCFQGGVAGKRKGKKKRTRPPPPQTRNKRLRGEAGYEFFFIFYFFFPQFHCINLCSRPSGEASREDDRTGFAGVGPSIRLYRLRCALFAEKSFLLAWSHCRSPIVR